MNQLIEQNLKIQASNLEQLKAEVANLEQTLAKKRADMLATSGAVQMLEALRKQSADEQPKPAE